MFTADDNPKEAYLLTGLKSLELAQCHDRGEIVFTQGGPTGGYWDWLPETPNTEKQP